MSRPSEFSLQSGIRSEIQQPRHEIENQAAKRKDDITEALFQSPEARTLGKSLTPDLSSQIKQFAIDVEQNITERARGTQTA
jgi:hypothetical protein